MAERSNSTSPLWVSKALPVGSYIHGVCCFQMQRGVWAAPSSLTTAPSLRQQRWAEGAGDHPTNPQLLTGTLGTATSLNTYRQTAGRGQGLGEDDLRLGEWERAHGGLKEPLCPKLPLLRDRSGVEETETTRELMLLPVFFKGKTMSTHSHLHVLILIQCDWLRDY